MVKRKDDGYWISHTEPIAAHHEDVFASITTPAGLTRWFPLAAEVDLREGGLIKLGWNEEFTRTTSVAILDYGAGGTIVWDWFASHQDFHAPLYWTVEPVLATDPATDPAANPAANPDADPANPASNPANLEGTIVHLEQGPFQADHESLIAMAEEAQFWAWHLCNLRSVLEASHDMRQHRPL